MVDYGLDVSTYPDLDPTFGWTSGITTLAQALARRLETPAGSLPYDPDYGLDLREYVADDLDDSDVLRLQSLIAAQAAQEERVLDANVTATQTLATQTLTLAIALRLADGTFALTIAIDDVSASVLSVTP